MQNEAVKIQTCESDARLARVSDFNAEQVAIIKKTVAKDTTDEELAFFLLMARSVGLNPFNKEIWCYKDNKGNLLIFAGRDGFLSAAQRNPKFNGLRSAYVCENDSFEIDIPNNIVKHSFGAAKRGEIIGAYAIAYRKDAEATVSWADFKTFNKAFNAWKTHPGEMIIKVAEAHALKKAFGISGVQAEETYDFRNDTFANVQQEAAIETEEFKKLITEGRVEISDEVKDEIASSVSTEQLVEIYNRNKDLHTNRDFMKLLTERKAVIKSLNLNPVK